MTTTKTTTSTTAQLVNKGEKSRVEAYGMQTDSFEISADVNIENGLLSGISNGTVTLNIEDNYQKQPINFYMTKDGKVYLLGAVELDNADMAIGYIQKFVDSVKGIYE